MHVEQFKQILPQCRTPMTWASLLETYLPQANIISKEQQAAFISQTGHESASYNVLEENLYYSSSRLAMVFPKYFRGVDPVPYHKKPEMIANLVYANRIGNGPLESGDGFRFRGRGVLQVTGRKNYAACSLFLFGDTEILLNNPDMLLDPTHAVTSALWYWQTNGLENVTDFVELTRKINGGTNGLEHRTQLYNTALNIL